MWCDRDTEHDCLGFNSYVEVLAEVCGLSDLAPLTMGIFGSWGSGKTSLMRMLQRRLDNAGDGVKTLWFNAWRYEGREEAQSALIHAILARLSEDTTLLENAKEVLGRLTKGASVLKLAKFIGKTAVTLTPDLDGFIDCFQEESKKIAETMEQFDKDFEEFLSRMQVRHIVVFIDDLDRCSSAKVIETFETIKLFLNTPACTFVIGADVSKIQDAVGEVYQVADSRRRKDYLEKIIQIPFTIPTQDLQDITCYVGMLLLARHLKEEGLKELQDGRAGFFSAEEGVASAIRRWPSDNAVHFDGNSSMVRAELDEVMPHIAILGRGLQGNPRQIKRFLNIVALRRRLAKANKLDVDAAILIKLAVLEYVWEDFFDSIAQTVDPITGQSELIEEMLKSSEDQSDDAQQSQLVAESLRQGGLLEFLRSEPKLTGSLDYKPYLFLAQTSLSRGQNASIESIDAKAKSLARSIESEDPLRAKTAAKQAAAQDSSVAATVVRIILADIPNAGTKVQTHGLNGLSAICHAHPEQYIPVLKFLSTFNAKNKEAVAVSATTIISAAKRNGYEVPDGLEARFTSQSKIAAALAPSTKRTAKKGQ